MPRHRRAANPQVWPDRGTLQMTKVPLIIFLLLVSSPATLSAGPIESDISAKEFQAFWTEFRQAVTANDKNKVVAMTRFPFKTRGLIDDDPVKTYSRESFLKIWDQLLQSDPGDSPDASTMQRFLERKTTISVRDSAGIGAFHIGRFVFEKIKEKWLFTMAYLDN
jgi:hypothetical protein